MKKASLLWVDLEMTGLDPTIDKIIEVGAIATDFNLNEIARFSAVVKVDQEFMEKRMVGKFWDKNQVARDGLIAQNLEKGESPEVVEQKLLDFLDENFDTKHPIYLAGNSIHQDQKFIEREWAKLNERLHYRQLDVSAWKIIFEQLGVKFNKPENHRAMDDIEGSIAELKFYLTKVKK
ncbi:MAG: oligoribonuclease [Candidatus Nomurabacteria bacterium]|jgi:oligoribonuclease|nr:oligoribonuclease [Candidatus Nomurabacteria bacterium]